MTRTIVTLALLLVAATSLAQSPVVVERVDVHATRTRPDIIIAEMRLPKRRSYTIAEIEQAVYRLRRLPFVVDATYTLEPGIAPDARVLRVNVIDETPVHLVFDIQALAQRGGHATTVAQMGWRLFPTSHGVVDLNMGGAGQFNSGGTGEPHLGDVSAQYTGYGLFGTSAYAGIGVATHYTSQDRLVSPMLLFGVPLTQTQTVRGSYTRTGEKSDNDALATVEWLMETTDDPYFARLGYSITAGPQWGKTRLVTDSNGGKLHIENDLNNHGFGVSAAKYWPMAEHGAYWARANGTYTDETPTSNGIKENTSHQQLGDLLGGVAWNFDQWRTTGEWFERVRLELGAGYHRERSHQASFVGDRSGAEVFVSAAYRTRLGIFRLALSRVNSKR